MQHRQYWDYCLHVLLCGLIIATTSVFASFEIQAHRAVQFDIDGVQLGSRRALLNQVAVDVTDPYAPHDLARQIAVLPMRKFSETLLREIVSERNAAGLLLLLSKDLSKIESQILLLERLIYSEGWEIPIYMTFDEMDFNVGDNLQIMYSGSEAKKMGIASSNTLHSWIRSAQESQEDSFTIGIAATYDTFGGSLSLANGLKQSGSGLIALLELMRLFNRSFKDLASGSSVVDLLFLVSGSGRFGFDSTGKWLDKADADVLASIDFVLCLDDLVSERPLYLHMSENPSNKHSASLVATLEDLSSELGIDFSVVVQSTDDDVDEDSVWQHEQFYIRDIEAATLSTNAEPKTSFKESSILDYGKKTDLTNLKEAISFIYEGVASFVLDAYSGDINLPTSLGIVESSRSVDENFVGSWIQYLGSQQRPSPFVSKKDDLLKTVEDTMKRHSDEKVSVQAFSLPSKFTFYKDTADEILLTVYSVKPFTFDLALAGGVVMYLAMFYVVTQMLSRAYDK